MQLDKFIVVYKDGGLPEVWNTYTYQEVYRNNPDHFKGYRILATFNENSAPFDTASIEKEAERLYADVDESTDYASDDYRINEVRKFQRSAHITCARQYMGEISTLKEVRDNLWKCFETEKNNHIHFANECEKLQAENSKMRKGLEEIQLIVATESREELNITGLLSLATEALK